MTGMINHLWQSTAFAALIALAAWAMRRNAPRARYRLWLAASLKFLVPFSCIVLTGARMPLPASSAPAFQAPPVAAVETYFAPAAVPMNPEPGKTPVDWALWLGVPWLGGALILAARRTRQWLALRRLANAATPVGGDFPAPVLESDSGIEPGVFGLFRPVILLPRGLAGSLPSEQMEAILRHELRHVRHRDNLTAALQMAVEMLFWFWPPVWWIGARMMEERERDCDAAALEPGGRAGVYARGILRVCESCVASPLPCAAGIAGADLKKRVREILSWRRPLPLTLHAKAALAAAAALAVLVPLAIGVARGQSVPASPLHFEAATIKPAVPNESGSYLGMDSPSELRVVNMSPAGMVGYAYGLRDFQVIGVPSWADHARFDVTAATGIEPSNTSGPVDEASGSVNEKVRLMLQSLLADRFGLQVHRETRTLPIFALIAAPGGLKLAPSHCVARDAKSASNADQATCGRRGIGRSRGDPNPTLLADGTTTEQLATLLSNVTGRQVVDRTGYTGTFDAQFPFAAYDANFPFIPPAPGAESTPAAAPQDASAPSLFTALQQQLGLKLEATHGPVEVLVIDRVREPTGN